MENSDFTLIKEIIIVDPPSHWDMLYKKPKYDRDGKPVTKLRFYLSGNLFYSDNGNAFTIAKIVYDSKEFLYPFLKGLPELEKMRLEFEYHKTTHIDLDNKANYWLKVFLDVLKTPSERQIKKAIQYKKPIISTNTIQDDNTKCIDEIKLKFVHGEHKMIFRIFGRVKTEQKTLNLVFI
jgi:hypothetical protein